MCWNSRIGRGPPSSTISNSSRRRSLMGRPSGPVTRTSRRTRSLPDRKTGGGFWPWPSWPACPPWPAWPAWPVWPAAAMTSAATSNARMSGNSNALRLLAFAEHGPELDGGRAGVGRGGGAQHVLDRAIRFGSAPHGAVEHREAGPRPRVVREYTDLFEQERFSFLVPLHARQRIADVVVEVVHLQRAPAHDVAGLQQGLQRGRVLAVVVEQQPLDVERHRQRRIRLLREARFGQRGGLVAPRERDLREDLVRAGRRDREGELAVFPRLVQTSEPEQLPGRPDQAPGLFRVPLDHFAVGAHGVLAHPLPDVDLSELQPHVRHAG